MDPPGIVIALASLKQRQGGSVPLQGSSALIVGEEYKMSHRLRLSASARMYGYAALATAAGAASTASAAVMIVDLDSPVGFDSAIDLGTAVGASASAFQAVFLQVDGIVAGGAEVLNGSAFFTGKWFGTDSVIGDSATGGNWVDGGAIGSLADGETGYSDFACPATRTRSTAGSKRR